MPRGRAKTKPRDWLVDPTQFGREPKQQWREVEPGTWEHVAQRAAIVQHYVVYMIRGQIELDGHPWTDVAKGCHALTYDGLMEVVRGEQHLTIADVIDLSPGLARSSSQPSSCAKQPGSRPTTGRVWAAGEGARWTEAATFVDRGPPRGVIEAGQGVSRTPRSCARGAFRQ